jgi:hypothetical protein
MECNTLQIMRIEFWFNPPIDCTTDGERSSLQMFYLTVLTKKKAGPWRIVGRRTGKLVRPPLSFRIATSEKKFSVFI